MKHRLIHATASLCFGLTATSLAAQPATGEPIKIGVLLPLTGPGAGLGIPQQNGILLAEKHINARGGIKGRPIKLIVEDDTTNPDVAISKANNLIFSQKVVALIGPTQTANTIAVGGLTDPIKLPHMALGGLGPPVEKTRRCVFHIAPAQVLNARAMLEYLKSIGAANVGALFDSGYGTVVYNELIKYSDSYGIKFVATEKFEVGATDTTTQAAKLRAAQPDAIVVVGVTGVPIRSIRQLQMKQPIVSAIGQATYEIVRSMGDAADNVVFPEALVAEDPLPQQKEFVELYRQEYKQLPKAAQGGAWDALQVVAAALNKVGPSAGNGPLCEAMRGEYSGVVTTYDFRAEDLNGMKLSNVVYSKLVNGQFSRLAFRAKD
jgi:branched-chain amino acid transport system substrate-binding protein